MKFGDRITVKNHVLFIPSLFIVPVVDVAVSVFDVEN